jgi:hypothetical protein
VTAQGWDGLAIGATVLVVLTLVGCAALGDDPKRSFSLPNHTGDARLVRRCHGSERVPERCRSPDEGELVQPGESLDFKLYFDEDRTYAVGDAEGTTLGCLTVPLAAGVDDYPDSLSDLEPCPTGTPKASG